MAVANVKDRIYIQEQVYDAGFDNCDVCSDGSVTIYIAIGEVRMCSFRGQIAWWCEIHRTKDEYMRVNDIYTCITEEFIEEQGWTIDQVSVLDWAYNMAPALDKYWKGDSPFDSIEEFIDHRKENSPRRFSLSITKRAVSATTDADDASQAQ